MHGKDLLEALEEGSWKFMKAGRSLPKISHLMFVDDLLLFGKATDTQMRVIKRIFLDKFCSMYGQRINYDKSNILFSKEYQ